MCPHSDYAAVAASGSSRPPALQVKRKKIVVNLPKEDITGDNGQVFGRASWAGNLPSDPDILPLPDVRAVETYSIEIYPSNDWRHDIPPSIDVFLPGKSAWDTMKQMAIEEKLETLGVEHGSGSYVPHINAPHTLAASISSPTDPALLLFKLNKFQQSQNALSNNSLAPSPQSPFGMSPSPDRQGPKCMMNSHGHSMSLAQPSAQYPYNNGSVASLNPFGHDAVLGSDQMSSGSPRVSPGPPGIGEIHAPQGRVPISLPSLAPPLSVSRLDSRPDFTRGFGLDISEEEEEEEGVAEDENISQADSDEEGFDEEVDDDKDQGTQDAGMTTASQNQRHSRHTSKLSAALSLRSFGVFNVDGLNERTDLEPRADGNISMETSRVTHPFVMRAAILAIAFAVLSVLAQSNNSVPVNYGIVVFPGFQALDVFGPLDALNILSFAYPLDLSIIAETVNPVTTRPQSGSMNPMNSNFSESIVPTHTFDSPPESLDVLIVPGGLGTRASNLNTTIDYIAATYPSLQYLITVCTGATLAARAGVLDGKNATTNKKSWEWATSQGPNVNWISHARWVVDGNIYTTSGVSAGIDGVFAFMEAVYGANATETVANSMEYVRETNSSWDPFAELYGL
ncbi:class I glutamine amidotransferase-like protein [Armillaria gallica]|uniref:Class I glutamine amidotransferase-like protein n=1 Tax=Armillaria gallica TaxID=47427 RepID=A0A2H3E219_ARMGA|nr:class I glutamine amidotransferase-like protein [Armillaria gallica]